MKNLNCQILSAPDTASATSAALDSSQLISISFQAIFGDATADGTFSIEASNDEDTSNYAGNFTPTNWTPIPSQSTTVTSGASVLLTVNTLSYRWLRCVYTRSSGGSSTIIVNIFAVSA